MIKNDNRILKLLHTNTKVIKENKSTLGVLAIFENKSLTIPSPKPWAPPVTTAILPFTEAESELSCVHRPQSGLIDGA